MSRKNIFKGLGISSIIIAGSLLVSSCTSKITEEQLMQLRELRKQEKNLTEMIQKKKDEKSKIEKELAARKAELDKCKETKAFVQDKLSKWPDIWPDWSPNK